VSKKQRRKSKAKTPQESRESIQKETKRADMDETTETRAYPGWIPPATGLKVNTLVSVVLALFVGWQTFQQTGDVLITIRLALVAGASIWVVFGFVLALTRVLRSR
jgi:hypothetical protein